MRSYVGLQAVGVVVEAAQLDKWRTVAGTKEQFRILGHHVFSASAYVGALMLGRAGCAAVSLGLVEVSTIFLDLLLLCKHEHYKDYIAAKLPWLLPFSGVMLWLSFIFGRLLMVPVFAGTFFMDSLTPAGQDVTWFERIYYCGVSALIWGLSAVWFRKIHAGMMKQIRLMTGAPAEPSKGKKAHSGLGDAAETKES